MSATSDTKQLRVQAIRWQAQGICSFDLVDPEDQALEPFEAGAHVDLHLPGGVVRSYSLASDPSDNRQWTFGVLLEAKSQGGSSALHNKVRGGDFLPVGTVRHAFPLAKDCHVNHCNPRA